MITVILGTSPYPFQRAIDWLSVLLNDNVIQEDVFVQHGVTSTSKVDQHPLVKLESIIESEKLIDAVGRSRMVISHAGQGSTRMLVAQGASFTLLPRLMSYEEHVDNHQLMFAQATHQLGVHYCLEFGDLKSAIVCPPVPLSTRNLFSGPKLSDHLCARYPNDIAYGHKLQV